MYNKNCIKLELLLWFLYKREVTRKKAQYEPIMTSSDGFYMTLPADGSIDVYPNNTLSNFTNRLVQPVDLSEGEWEVGLFIEENGSF